MAAQPRPDTPRNRGGTAAPQIMDRPASRSAGDNAAPVDNDGSGGRRSGQGNGNGSRSNDDDNGSSSKGQAGGNGQGRGGAARATAVTVAAGTAAMVTATVRAAGTAVEVARTSFRRLGRLPRRLGGPGKRSGMDQNWGLIAILAVQAVSAVLFIANMGSSILGIAPIAWIANELIEIAAAMGLILGAILGGIALRRSQIRTRDAEAKLRAASGAFMSLLEERFAAWGLTPAQRDVALFAIKGMSTAEIAALRGSSEGTVKAQTAAIYRKAGVTGRPQLLSVFIEDLMDGPLVEGRRCHHPGLRDKRT